MEKLFDDTLFIPKERPTKITDQQKKQMFIDLANLVIKYGFSIDSEKIIAKDLKKLSTHDTGFEKAKDLEKYGNAEYEFDGEFIDWLDGIVEFTESSILKENVKLWVKAHNPLSKFEVGTQLKINVKLNSRLDKDLIIYITGIKTEEAVYTVSEDKETQGGYLITFEKLESNCVILE